MNQKYYHQKINKNRNFKLDIEDQEIRPKKVEFTNLAYREYPKLVNTGIQTSIINSNVDREMQKNYHIRDKDTNVENRHGSTSPLNPNHKEFRSFTPDYKYVGHPESKNLNNKIDLRFDVTDITGKRKYQNKFKTEIDEKDYRKIKMLRDFSNLDKFKKELEAKKFPTLAVYTNEELRKSKSEKLFKNGNQIFIPLFNTDYRTSTIKRVENNKEAIRKEAYALFNPSGTVTRDLVNNRPELDRRGVTHLNKIEENPKRKYKNI